MLSVNTCIECWRPPPGAFPTLAITLIVSIDIIWGCTSCMCLCPRPTHRTRYTTPLFLRLMWIDPPCSLQRHRLLFTERQYGEKQILRGHANSHIFRHCSLHGMVRMEWYDGRRSLWCAGRVMEDGANRGSSCSGHFCGSWVCHGE